MEITSKRQSSSFGREWAGLLFTMVWFFGTMYSYYDPLFSNDITELVFMLLLGSALLAIGGWCGADSEKLANLPRWTAPAGAVTTALIPWVEGQLLQGVYWMTALLIAPLLCRRVYGILRVARRETRYRSFLSVISVMVLLQMTWIVLPLPYPVKFALLSVFALLGAWGASRRLPAPHPPLEIAQNRVFPPLRIFQMVLAGLLLFGLNLFNGLISYHVVFQNIYNNELLTLLASVSMTALGFWLYAAFTDFKRDIWGFFLGMTLIQAGCLVALLPESHVMAAPMVLLGKLGGPITEYYFLTLPLLFFDSSRKPILVAVLGLAFNVLNSGLMWVSAWWTPAFLSEAELTRPLVIFGALTVVLLLPVVVSLWEWNKNRTLMIALQEFRQQEANRALPEAAQEPEVPSGTEPEWTSPLQLQDSEQAVTLMLCEGKDRREIAEALGLTAHQVEMLLRSVQEKLGAAPAAGRTPAMLEAITRFGLTEREAEVFEQLLLGHSNPEISEKLFVVEATVKYHVRNILKKAGVQNRTQLIAQMEQNR